MSKIICGLLFVFCAVAPSFACDVAGIEKDAPNLCGVAKQGGLVYGEVSGWDVFYNDLKISQNDVFVAGLDRDAPALKLKFCIRNSQDCRTYSYAVAPREYLEQKIDVDDRFVSYAKDIEKRIDVEAARIQSARAKSMNDDALYFMAFELPKNLKRTRVSGVFGSRRIFNGVPKSPHRGLDFAAAAGTPVHPIADGRVMLAENHYMNGNIVLISHGHGVVSAYLHLNEINAKPGESVTRNDVIGRVGSTGRSSGAHLHLGLYWNQTAIDPGLFLLGKE